MAKDYREIVGAVLDKIRKELNRCFWNVHQKEMDSPFDNTGNKYVNDVFSVAAYNWNEPENPEPNFQYKDFKCYWYKYSTRGVYFDYPRELTLDFLDDMLNDCINSIEKDFMKKERNTQRV